LRHSHRKKNTNIIAATIAHLLLPSNRLRFAGALFVTLVIIGSSGYHAIENWSLLDSVFMTVITLSGVGYGEVHHLSPGGMVFSIFLIVFGVTMVGWALVTTFEVLTSEQLMREKDRKKTEKIIKAMRNHFIICGFGRMGRSIVEGLRNNDYEFVIIECDPVRADELRAEGLPYVLGDAASDEVLEKAGIMDAKALITVTPSDAINTYIILSAHWMNPHLQIVARAVGPDCAPKLYRAGASKVISPYMLGGWWMAATAINPAATDFIEGLRLAESNDTSLFEFVAGSAVHGKLLGEMRFKEETGVLVVAVRLDDQFIVNPPDDFLLQFGTAIIAIGSTKELKKMASLLEPGKPMEITAPLRDVA
jgi:voltage-gated potassium channel